MVYAENESLKSFYFSKIIVSVFYDVTPYNYLYFTFLIL